MSQNFPQFGLGIDWETSGYSTPNYASKHQGISFGAIIFDLRTLEPVEKLYKEIRFRPDLYQWDSGAQRIHGITQERLAQGVSQEAAALELGNLVVKYIGTNEVILLGHRVYFDKAFTSQLMGTLGIDFTYHPTMIDSSSMGTILLEANKSDEVFSLMGMPPRDKHNALEDIEYTLESIKKMKSYFMLGLASTL